MANTVTTPGAVGYKTHYAESTGDVYGLKVGEAAQTVIGSVTLLLATVLEKK